MILVNGSCSDCGQALAAGDIGIHQAFHDRARIESDPKHQEAIKDIPKAADERTPLGPEDIVARSKPQA